MIRFACLFLFAVPIYAGEVGRADVKYKAGVYDLALDMVINANQEAVYAVVTDYEHLDRISDVLVEARLLKNFENGKKRRLLVAQTCILFFCFKINMTEDVEEIGKEIVFTNIIPELSDISYGKTEWRVIAEGENRSRIQFRCEQDPNFWIPPLIGPVLMKHKMLSEARKTVERIEYLTTHE